MAMRPVPVQVVRAGAELGNHLRKWRTLLGLDVVLNVLRSLGQLDTLVGRPGSVRIRPWSRAGTAGISDTRSSVTTTFDYAGEYLADSRA
jgi:hypothetical protein